MKTSPIPCVGVIVFRGNDVLLIKRKNPPKAGEWSIPGGRMEDGESQEAAVKRELSEETGVRARLLGKVAEIDANFGKFHYLLHDYAAAWISGEPNGADDALHAEFVPIARLESLGLWDKTIEVIHEARCLYVPEKSG